MRPDRSSLTGDVTTGTVILLAALLLAAGFALHRRRVDGRFAATGTDAEPGRTEPGRTEPARTEPAQATVWARVQDALPSAEPGERATLVQFSSAFCAPCRTTRVVLDEVARREDGVEHVEVDAEQHLDLVRALDVRRTPTTLILDAAGREIVRAAGAPQRHQVLAALPGASA
jgi:MYXO-CTERM domain-containing protein